MKLSRERLILRDLKRADASSIARHVNNRNITRYLLVVPYPYSLKDGHAYVSSCIKNARKPERTEYSLGITLKKHDEVIGIITLTDIDQFQGTGKMGYWLSQNYWRQGIMTEAAVALIDFAFKKIKLRRINISAFVENKASNGLIQKLGFVQEGTSRKKVRCRATGILDPADFTISMAPIAIYLSKI